MQLKKILNRVSVVGFISILVIVFAQYLAGLCLLAKLEKQLVLAGSSATAYVFDERRSTIIGDEKLSSLMSIISISKNYSPSHEVWHEHCLIKFNGYTILIGSKGGLGLISVTYRSRFDWLSVHCGYRSHPKFNSWANSLEGDLRK